MMFQKIIFYICTEPQKSPVKLVTHQLVMSNGQLWGYAFDYPTCRVKRHILAEGEEYTQQTLEVEYWNEDWEVFRKVVSPDLANRLNGCLYIVHGIQDQVGRSTFALLPNSPSFPLLCFLSVFELPPSLFMSISSNPPGQKEHLCENAVH